MKKTKPFWTSKTLWANAVAVGALYIQTKTGFVVEPDLQAYALMGLNALLRFITQDEITMS